MLHNLLEMGWNLHIVNRFTLGLACFVLTGSGIAVAEFELSGQISAEARLFTQTPGSTNRTDLTSSLAFKPEFYFEWNNGSSSFLFVPFARLDENDSRRTHVDVREFTYIRVGNDWELRAGLRKVFWGVAESNHLVDVINQTDLVENTDGEDKFGQPMVNLALIRGWGTLDFFVLPGFRERSFPGRSGRLRSVPRVDTSSANYESAAEQRHVDYAVRYSHYLGAFDLGIYHFWGTSREPFLELESTPSGEVVLAPAYDIIHQTGGDLQATLGNNLLKLEVLRRQGQGEPYTAAVGGFEYTFVGFLETTIDFGILGEYHFDERGRSAPTPFNHDAFTGARLAINDAADTQVLAGVVADLYGGGYLLNVEASRRFGNYWKLDVEARFLLGMDNADLLYSMRRDDHVLLELQRFF